MMNSNNDNISHSNAASLQTLQSILQENECKAMAQLNITYADYFSKLRKQKEYLTIQIKNNYKKEHQKLIHIFKHKKNNFENDFLSALPKLSSNETIKSESILNSPMMSTNSDSKIKSEDYSSDTDSDMSTSTDSDSDIDIDIDYETDDKNHKKPKTFSKKQKIKVRQKRSKPIKNPTANEILANAFHAYSTKNIEKALVLFERRTKLKPLSISANYNLGILLSKQQPFRYNIQQLRVQLRENTAYLTLRYISKKVTKKNKKNEVFHVLYNTWRSALILLKSQKTQSKEHSSINMHYELLCAMLAALKLAKIWMKICNRCNSETLLWLRRAYNLIPVVQIPGVNHKKNGFIVYQIQKSVEEVLHWFTFVLCEYLRTKTFHQSFVFLIVFQKHFFSFFVFFVRKKILCNWKFEVKTMKFIKIRITRLMNATMHLNRCFFI